jgi:hypothetical protein
LSRPSGRDERVQVTLDEDESGIATFVGSETAGLKLHVMCGSRTLAQGSLVFPAQPFKKQLTFRSAVVSGQAHGPFEFEVHVTEGRLVLGRIGHLELRIHDSRRQPLSLPVTLETQGLTVVSPNQTQGNRSDVNGCLRFTVLPTDLSVSLRFVAVSALLGPGELVAEVPVETAQFWGQRAASGLELVSLLPVSSLHYAFINEQGVWSRGHVPLEDMEGHGRIARIADSENVIGPRWLVVGREPALDGAASIGWPLDDSTSEARSTVSMRERLLLDGKVQARREYEHVRTVRVSRILFGFVTVSVLFLLTVIGYLVHGSQPIPSIEDEDGERLEVPVHSQRRSLLLLLGLVVVLAALGAWIVLRTFQAS